MNTCALWQEGNGVDQRRLASIGGDGELMQVINTNVEGEPSPGLGRN